MKKYSYRTKNTCSQVIEFTLDGDIVKDVKFLGGGCPGNLQALPRLVEGLRGKRYFLCRPISKSSRKSLRRIKKDSLIQKKKDKIYKQVVIYIYNHLLFCYNIKIKLKSRKESVKYLKIKYVIQ